MPDIHPKLQNLISLIPIFQEIFPFDSRPAVSDLEKFLAIFPGKNFTSEYKDSELIGRPLTKGDGMYDAVHENKLISSVIPKEIFGSTFRNVSKPIFDDHDKEKMIGALGFAYSIETQFVLQEMAQTLSSSSEELNAVAEEFSATALSLSGKMNELSSSSNSMFQKLEKTDNILLFIDNLADRTKLLGLNALIEAARAGEHGRSFSVVAHEIQKMSENSAKSVNEIKDLLRGIQNEVKLVNNLINETSNLSSQQSIGSLEISKSLESLSKISETINEISQKL